MPEDHNFLSLIVSHLNDPANAAVEAELAKLRAQSIENEAYFKQIEKLWLLSSKAQPLHNVTEKQAVERLKIALKPHAKVNKLSWPWLRSVAAVLLAAIGVYLLYQSNNRQVWLTKSTLASQIDSVTLSDGSVIVLAPNSQIKYPEKFKGSERDIFFAKGQAFFRIAKDTLKPFKISINQSNVTVLGTSFNINLSSSAVCLSVKTGTVMFSPYNGGNSAILTAGQAINYDTKNNQYTTINARNADAWLTHQLVFKDTPLDVVCNQLSEYYKVPVKLKNYNKTIKELNATFTNNTLNEVLEILSETYNIKVSKQPHQIILTSY